MLKAEELNLLDQIKSLIDSAGADSYIGMTFKGVAEICRRNIENDFGDSPVQDLDLERERRNADVCMKNAEIDSLRKEKDELFNNFRKLLKEREMADSIIRENNRVIAELEEERDAISDSVDGLQEIIDKQESEIIRLKAEVYDHMRKERDAK